MDSQTSTPKYVDYMHFWLYIVGTKIFDIILDFVDAIENRNEIAYVWTDLKITQRRTDLEGYKRSFEFNFMNQWHGNGKTNRFSSKLRSEFYEIFNVLNILFNADYDVMKNFEFNNIFSMYV